MELDPICDLFPKMSDEEFDALCQDIKDNGLREPIWTRQGKIIDGRNRWNACKRVGVVPQTREWNGKGSLVAFVVSLNLHRRHLSTSQRSIVAAKARPVLEAELKLAATERKIEGNRRGGSARPSQPSDQKSAPISAPTSENQPIEQTSAKLEPKPTQMNISQRSIVAAKAQPSKSKPKTTPTPPQSGEVREQVATIFSIGKMSLDAATKIVETSPELAKQVEQGNISLNAAVKQLPHPADQLPSSPAQQAEEQRVKYRQSFRKAVGLIRRIIAKYDPEEVAAALEKKDMSLISEWSTLTQEWMLRFERAQSQNGIRTIGRKSG